MTGTIETRRRLRMPLRPSERRIRATCAVGRRSSDTQWITRKGRTTAARLTRRQQLGEHRQRRVPGAAVGVHQRARRGAEARAPHRIRHQARRRLFELALGPHLHRRAVGEERVGNLARSSACAGRRRSACRGPPARGCCGRPPARGFRRRTPRSRSDRAAPARRSCRATTASARGSASIGSSLRRTVDSPSCRQSRSTSSNRSGWRAAMISSALPPAAVVRTRLNARITGSSSPFDVLPATSTRRPGEMRKNRSTRSRPRPGVGDGRASRTSGCR